MDTTAKVVGIAAGSTIVYNSWLKSSSPSEDDNKQDKKENKINKLPIKNPMENNYMKHLFSFPFIFYNLDINVDD